MTTITARLPDEIDDNLQHIARAEQLDKSDIIRRLLARGIQQWKLTKAVEEYKKGAFSTEEAAQFAEISVWEFFDALKEQQIPLTYDAEELKEDLKTIRWKSR